MKTIHTNSAKFNNRLGDPQLYMLTRDKLYGLLHRRDPLVFRHASINAICINFTQEFKALMAPGRLFGIRPGETRRIFIDNFPTNLNKMVPYNAVELDQDCILMACGPDEATVVYPENHFSATIRLVKDSSIMVETMKILCGETVVELEAGSRLHIEFDKVFVQLEKPATT